MIYKTSEQTKEDWDIWLTRQIEYLRQKEFSALDLVNVIEELEDLGKEQRNACRSFCRQIIVHLLLIDYWYEQTSTPNHWRAEIASFQSELEDRLTTNYRRYLKENLTAIYQQSLRIVRRQTELDDRFPQQCPYTIEQIIEVD